MTPGQLRLLQGAGYETGYHGEGEGIGGPVVGGISAADIARGLGGGRRSSNNRPWGSPGTAAPSPYADGSGRSIFFGDYTNPVMGQIYQQFLANSPTMGGSFMGPGFTGTPVGGMNNTPNAADADVVRLAQILARITGSPSYGIQPGQDQPLVGLVSPVSDKIYGVGRLGGSGVGSTATPEEMYASLGGRGGPTPNPKLTPSFDQSWLTNLSYMAPGEYQSNGDTPGMHDWNASQPAFDTTMPPNPKLPALDFFSEEDKRRSPYREFFTRNSAESQAGSSIDNILRQIGALQDQPGALFSGNTGKYPFIMP